MKTPTVLISLLFFLIGFRSIACSCPVYKNLERFQLSEFERSECIFVGEVLEINLEKNSYRIKVLDALKGTDNGLIYEGTYDDQCGPKIYELGKWIFYGYPDSNGALKVNDCGLTRPFKNPMHDFLDFEKSEPEIKRQAQTDLKYEIESLRKK